MATYSGSRQQARRRRKRTSKQDAFSKKLIDDIRSLLWIVTVGGLLLAFYCVKRNYTGALPWIGAMVAVVGTWRGMRILFEPV